MGCVVMGEGKINNWRLGNWVVGVMGRFEVRQMASATSLETKTDFLTL